MWDEIFQEKLTKFYEIFDFFFIEILSKPA